MNALRAQMGQDMAAAHRAGIEEERARCVAACRSYMDAPGFPALAQAGTILQRINSDWQPPTATHKRDL